MNVLSPLATGRPAVRALAPRPASLRGARIGVLDNAKPNADALLGRAAECLRRRPAAPPSAWPSTRAPRRGHARTLAASGWSTDEVRRRLWERARVPLAAFGAENLARFAVIAPALFADRPAGTAVGICYRPQDVMIVAAGGPGKHSAIVPTFGATRAVTLRVTDA